MMHGPINIRFLKWSLSKLYKITMPRLTFEDCKMACWDQFCMWQLMLCIVVYGRNTLFFFLIFFIFYILLLLQGSFIFFGYCFELKIYNAEIAVRKLYISFTAWKVLIYCTDNTKWYIQAVWSYTYLLTYSMMQSPSWEANWFAASQEIPRILWKPKVHYRSHKRPPPVAPYLFTFFILY